MSVDKFSFGGVNSQANPTAMPDNRALRCLNWVPTPWGMELRRGYSKPATSGAAPVDAIHSIFPYEKWDGTRYLIVGSSTKLHSLALATGVWTLLSSTLSGSKLGFFTFGGQIHIGDGTTVYFFDGTTLRRSGIRSLTLSEAQGITVNIGTSTQDLSAVTLAFSSGGAWAGNDVYGEWVYYSVWDKVAGTISPASKAVPSARQKGLAGQKLTASSLPSIGASQVWVPVITTDGGDTPFYILARSGALVPTTSYVWSGYTCNVTAAGHGLTNGDPILVAIPRAIGYIPYGPIKATVSDSSHYSFTLPGPFTGNPKVYACLTGATINNKNDINAGVVSFAVQSYGNGGFPASTVQGAQPGYQLYACIWNPITGHVGNRMPIGQRVKPTTPSTISVGSLPNLSAENPEWEILIGSSNDGAEVPYLLLDPGSNWLSVASGTTTAEIDGSYVFDPTSEMPYRNGIAPGMDKFCVIGDQALGCTGRDAYVYVSASEKDPINPQIVGKPAQSWAPNDVVQFPTKQVPTAIHEWNQVALVFSRTYSAPLVNMQGVWDWGQGFPIGCAGQRAFAKTNHGPFWVTGQKQLATANDLNPFTVSDEYEAALLAKIGDAYLGEVEVVPYVDVAKRKDELIIKCRDANGNPFEIVHDFRMKDDRSPYGQAYERKYGAALATNYTLAEGVDVNGIARAYAGGSDCSIYQLEAGHSDNGAEFSADYIWMSNMGADKPQVYDISIWGDAAVVLSTVGKADASDSWVQATSRSDKGDGDHDFKRHNRIKRGEMQFCYMRLQLTSHSADAPAGEISDPPHYPFESYGKVFMGRAHFGASRGE